LAQTHAAMQAAADALARAEHEIVDRSTETATALAKTMLCLAQAILAAEANAQAPAQIARLFALVLPPIRHLPGIMISVHPLTLASLSAPMKDAVRGYGGNVSLNADASLAPGDIRVDWPGGRAMRLEAQFQRSLQELLLPFQDPDAAALPPQPTPEPVYGGTDDAG